jgi:hypothetical protein
VVLKYERLTKDRRQLLALTGLTRKEFVELHRAFRHAYEKVHPGNETVGGNVRKRKAGGGRKGQLSTTEQKLLFSLVYQKTYPLQALLGEVFELSQSRANRWIHRLLPILKQALDDLGVLPTREPGHFARWERRHQEAVELIIDGTDRRRQRPKNQTKQALHYSGKHKTHSDKNVVVVNAKTKRVGYLSQTYAGKIHDKKIVDTEPIRYPRATILYKDTGFQGYEPKVHQPHQPKKTAQGDLNPWAEAAQSQAVSGPGPRGACPCGGETLPDREGGLSQYQRGLRRLGNGRGMWLTQSPRAATQTPTANMRENYSA